MSFHSKSGNSVVSESDLGCKEHLEYVTFLELFETLKGDLELIRSQESGGIVNNLDTEKGDHGHGD